MYKDEITAKLRDIDTIKIKGKCVKSTDHKCPECGTSMIKFLGSEKDRDDVLEYLFACKTCKVYFAIGDYEKEIEPKEIRILEEKELEKVKQIEKPKRIRKKVEKAVQKEEEQSEEN